MFSRLFKIKSHSSHSILLLGPRGTGKTYWLKQLFPDALYFDLLDSETYLGFSASPRRLGDLIPTDYQGWVVIDEVQKIPGLLDEVHRLTEGRRLKFLLTGSSARSLRKKGVNLLAGRALTYRMYPLTVSELAADFNLQTSLRLGHLPMVYQHQKPEYYLKSYINTYLKEEVQQESLTRNLSLFTRFLEVASFSQGEVLNYTNIAREIGSNRHTVSNFFTILEDLLLSYRIPVFSRRAKRELITHEKFYYFDVGIYRSLRAVGPLDSDAEIEGAALETLFLQEVIAINHYKELGYQIYYWRTRSGVEVDFVLYGKRGLLAFEIKRKKKLTKKDFSGLLQFKSDYPVAKCFMLYGGVDSYSDSDIQVMSFEETLDKIKVILRGEKDL